MSKGRRDIPFAVKTSVLEAMEDGLSASEAARVNGVDAGTAIKWWRSVYGGIPWPAFRKPEAKLRYIRAHRGWVTITEFECSNCGGLVHHVALDVGKPNYCPWCGEAVE